MASIPLIQQTTNVSPVTPSPQAQGMQVVDPLGNAPQVAAQGLDEMASAKVYEQNALFHKENADAVANLSKPISDAQIYWKQALVDAQKQSVDGGMIEQPDGTRIGIREKVQSDFDSWSKTFLDGVQNPKAKQIALEQLSHLRTATVDGALTVEAQAGIANRSQKVDEAVQGWASQAAGAKNVADVDALVQTAKTFIANSGFDETTRNQKAKAAVLAIVEAANTGAMERDPAGYKAAALSRYGIDPTAPATPSGTDAAAVTAVAGRLGISPTDLATVISYETGGKFSPSIRGGTDNKHIGLIQFGENEQKAYGADQSQSFSDQMMAVERYLKDRGVKPGDNLATLYRIVNGGNRDASMQSNDGNGTIEEHVTRMQNEHVAGAQKFLGTTTATAGTPSAPVDPQMASLVNQLPIERLPAYISSANTGVNQQQALARSQITTIENDHVSAYMNGQTVPQPLTQADYTKAYGAIEGPQRFANYQQIQQLGSDITSMKAMPPQQMVAMVENYKAAADPNKPGYEIALKRYETVAKAADQVNQARQADPAAYALQNGIGGATPLDFTNTETFSKSLAQRQGVAQTMQETFQTPLALLSKSEATTLNQGFQTMTTQQRLGYLNAIQTAVKDPTAYRAIMQQIAPDSPVTAMAGMILSKQQPMVDAGWFSDSTYRQQDVAGLLLEGEALINPNRTEKGENGKGKVFPMPKEQDMHDQFSNAVGKAFAGDPNGQSFAYQAVKAYYAGQSARTGDISGTLDTGRLKDAINAVVGGVTDMNGKGEVVRPWGMSESTFKDQAKVAFDNAMQSAGYKGTRVDNFGIYGLQSAGDGKYLLRNGTSFLVDKNDNPVMLVLNQNSQPPNVQPAPGVEPPAVVVPPKTDKPTTKLPRTK